MASWQKKERRHEKTWESTLVNWVTLIIQKRQYVNVFQRSHVSEKYKREEEDNFVLDMEGDLEDLLYYEDLEVIWKRR